MAHQTVVDQITDYGDIDKTADSYRLLKEEIASAIVVHGQGGNFSFRASFQDRFLVFNGEVREQIRYPVLYGVPTLTKQLIQKDKLGKEGLLERCGRRWTGRRRPEDLVLLASTVLPIKLVDTSTLRPENMITYLTRQSEGVDYVRLFASNLDCFMSRPSDNPKRPDVDFLTVLFSEAERKLLENYRIILELHDLKIPADLP